MVPLMFPVPALIAAPCTLTGDIRAHAVSGRTVLVRLPTGYDSPANRKRRYPVFYLQDGQNLFDGATSFIGGQEWKADETASLLEARGEIEPVILVAVYNAGTDRMKEYAPYPDTKYKGGGAAIYGEWLSGILKTFVDATYRTKTDPANTALGGSSLGGLFALHQAITHSEIWGKAAVMSPSAWWADRAILQTVTDTPKKPIRLWIDIGTREDESGNALKDAQQLRDTLITRGYKPEADFRYAEAPGAAHNEAAWSARFPDVLRYLFGVNKK
ncbi:MAG: alpha/beta hydrolase [Alphaproteobacteria bacterium]|nr:MAG: alpha/beta hydrolase [Alphaproteobacteria bacterium]